MRRCKVNQFFAVIRNNSDYLHLALLAVAALSRLVLSLAVTLTPVAEVIAKQCSEHDQKKYKMPSFVPFILTNEHKRRTRQTL